MTKVRRKSWDRVDRENETGVKGAKEVVRWDRNRLEKSERKQQFTGRRQKKLLELPPFHSPRIERFLKCYHFSALCRFGNSASHSPATERDNLVLPSATVLMSLAESCKININMTSRLWIDHGWSRLKELLLPQDATREKVEKSEMT